jgi:hypothetical protein
MFGKIAPGPKTMRWPSQSRQQRQCCCCTTGPVRLCRWPRQCCHARGRADISDGLLALVVPCNTNNTGGIESSHSCAPINAAAIATTLLGCAGGLQRPTIGVDGFVEYEVCEGQIILYTRGDSEMRLHASHRFVNPETHQSELQIYHGEPTPREPKWETKSNYTVQRFDSPTS